MASQKPLKSLGDSKLWLKGVSICRNDMKNQSKISIKMFNSQPGFGGQHSPDYPPYENNASERAIRNVKIKQKVSGGFRSYRGAEIFAILRSVVDTIIKKGGNPPESIRFAINVASIKNQMYLKKKNNY